jgi:hypothetical protein
MAYVDYVNSFYSNDVKMLKKRQKQSKYARAAALTSATVLAGLGLLPENKVKIPCLIGSIFSFLAVFNTHNYIKSVDKKIQLNSVV